MEINHISFLKDVLPEDFLELSEGLVVRNLGDLVVSLEKMSNDDFDLHVYGSQNDFAEWILEGYWDENLAGKILGIRDKGRLVKLLRKVLKKAESEKIGKIGKKRKSKNVLREISELHDK